jgi:hypothetical protein
MDIDTARLEVMVEDLAAAYRTAGDRRTRARVARVATRSIRAFGIDRRRALNVWLTAIAAAMPNH